MSKIIAYYIALPFKLRVGICLAYGLIMTWLSLAPASLVQRLYPNFQHGDKVAHFMMYGALVLLARLAWRDPRTIRIPHWIIPVAALAYGFLMEAMQWVLVKYDRSFEVSDILANGLGAFCCWYLIGYGVRKEAADSQSSPKLSQP
jgi:VanZ family protein